VEGKRQDTTCGTKRRRWCQCWDQRRGEEAGIFRVRAGRTSRAREGIVCVWAGEHVIERGKC
jgi:hypothetical protein